MPPLRDRAKLATAKATKAAPATRKATAPIPPVFGSAKLPPPSWPFGYTLSMIGGKWRLVIMYWLVECETMRFNELKRKIGRITDKTLSRQLKDLEADGLIVRTEYPQIPPKVEYRLSEKGKSLYPLMEAMCEWGREHGAPGPDAPDEPSADLRV